MYSRNCSGLLNFTLGNRQHEQLVIDLLTYGTTMA